MIGVFRVEELSGIQEFRLEQAGCWSFMEFQGLSDSVLIGFGLAEFVLGFRLAECGLGLRSLECGPRVEVSLLPAPPTPPDPEDRRDVESKTHKTGLD